MINLYDILSNIFLQSTTSIQNGIYHGANIVYNNAFFTSAFALAILWLGWLIAFQKITNEELLYKFIWALLMFSLVKLLLYDKSFFNYLIELVNIPRVAFNDIVVKMVETINGKASTENIVNTLVSSMQALYKSIFAQAGITNLAGYLFGFIVWLSGTFLILITLLMTVFSTFLTEIILSLLPIVIPTLIWKRTEYIFFGWIKLYISVSLYTPFTVIFGLVSIQIVNLSMDVTEKMSDDFQANINLILILVIGQCLVALSILKIPNIINQLIGSSNPGESLTSGVGTISAGASMLSTVGKMAGLKVAGAGAKKGAGYVTGKAMDWAKNKVKVR